MMQQATAWKWRQWETQIRNSCSFCWCKSSNNIHIINCKQKGWTTDFIQIHTLQKITRLQQKITKSLCQSKNH